MPFFRRLSIIAIAILTPNLFAADSSKELPNSEHGKTTFNTMCGVCHSVQKTGGPVEGPNLIGLVGREAASQPEFDRYSPALSAADIVWTVEALDRFLKNPMGMVPGTFMPMLISDDKTRADVIAYLETLQQQD